MYVQIDTKKCCLLNVKMYDREIILYISYKSFTGCKLHDHTTYVSSATTKRYKTSFCTMCVHVWVLYWITLSRDSFLQLNSRLVYKYKKRVHKVSMLDSCSRLKFFNLSSQFLNKVLSCTLVMLIHHEKLITVLNCTLCMTISSATIKVKLVGLMPAIPFYGI